MAVCLTDPLEDDHPIVFVNEAFESLTGYAADEVLGRNCRFLQGAETDPEHVRALGEAIGDEDVVVLELVNYRKNGERFVNALHLGPIYDDDGALVYYFGSMWDVSELRELRDERERERAPRRGDLAPHPQSLRRRQRRHRTLLRGRQPQARAQHRAGASSR